MTRQELASCIFVMGITTFILLLFRIPISYVKEFFYLTIHSAQNDLFQIGSNIIKFVIDCCYWSFFLVVFIYIFRVVYLDNPKYKRKKVLEKEPIEKKEIITEEKIEIDKKKKKATNNIDILCRFLEKTVMFFVKLFICFIILPTLFILFFLCAVLFIYLFLLFKGVFYVSVLIGIPFAILFILTILEVLINIVIRRRVNERRLMITFLASIVGLGASFGILLLDINSIQYVDKVPKEAKLTTETKDYEMNDDLYFLFANMAEYQVDNSLEKVVRIEFNYYKDYTEITFPSVHSSLPYHEKPYTIINRHLFSILIDDLAHRKIHNYGELNSVNIKIYASEENIEKLKRNYEKEMNRIDQQREEEYAQDKMNHYMSQIEELEQEKSLLDTENQELNNRILELEMEIEGYQDKLERLQNIMEE